MTEKDLHHHEGRNICSKCYDLLYRPRVWFFVRISDNLDDVQEYLAEGEETAAEERERLAREAEERDRLRLAGEEERMRAEFAEKDEFKFSFLKIADIVGILPDTLGL